MANAYSPHGSASFQQGPSKTPAHSSNPQTQSQNQTQNQNYWVPNNRRRKSTKGDAHHHSQRPPSQRPQRQQQNPNQHYPPSRRGSFRNGSNTPSYHRERGLSSAMSSVSASTSAVRSEGPNTRSSSIAPNGEEFIVVQSRTRKRNRVSITSRPSSLPNNGQQRRPPPPPPLNNRSTPLTEPLSAGQTEKPPTTDQSCYPTCAGKQDSEMVDNAPAVPPGVNIDPVHLTPIPVFSYPTDSPSSSSSGDGCASQQSYQPPPEELSCSRSSPPPTGRTIVIPMARAAVEADPAFLAQLEHERRMVAEQERYHRWRVVAAILLYRGTASARPMSRSVRFRFPPGCERAYVRSGLSSMVSVDA